jgi:hypothetical protein
MSVVDSYNHQIEKYSQVVLVICLSVDFICNETFDERISTDRNVPKCILELFEKSFDSPRISRNPTTTKQRDSLKTCMYLRPPSCGNTAIMNSRALPKGYDYGTHIGGN